MTESVLDSSMTQAGICIREAHRYLDAGDLVCWSLCTGRPGFAGSCVGSAG